MTTYDFIQELQADLATTQDATERQQIAAALAAAEQQHATEEAAFEALMSAEPPQ